MFTRSAGLTPARLPPVVSDQRARLVQFRPKSGRLELAQWLADPENPLPARVMANRTWHWLFGAGIVRTTDNFGTTGELPSHPELLDFLASRFVAEHWSVQDARSPNRFVARLPTIDGTQTARI